MIKYTEEKLFTREQTEALFLSVGWVSGKYPDKLYKALLNSSSVITAWDGSRLAGLLRALDDGEMLAFIHYVLVDPQYQGLGVAGKLVEMAKKKYKDFLYIEAMPEESKNVPFYQRHGFQIMKDGVPIQICNHLFGQSQ